MCGICGKITDNYLCKKCSNKLLNDAIFGIDKYNGKYFDNHYYLFKYDGLIREKILDYKFNEKTYLYKTFMSFLFFYQKNYFQFNFYDIIIPVPISKKRLKLRGYNQSKLIALEIKKYLNIRILNNVLIKNTNNKPQSTLSKERKRKKC